MKISQSLLTSCLGFAAWMNLSIAAPTAPIADDHHDHDHKHATHDHEPAEGESCAEDDHDHDHEHAEGEPCTEDDHDHAEGEPCAEDAHQHSAGEACSGSAQEMIPVKIDDKARHSLNMQVERVVARSHQASKSFYGQLEIPPHAIQTCVLPAAGRVNLHIQSAQQVKKGELLYTLESPDIVELKGILVQNEANLARNQEELQTLLNRKAQLDGIGTKNSELETSIRFKQAERPGLESAVVSSQSKLALATSGGELKGNVLYVCANRDGSVQSVGISRGAWGEQGSPVLVLTNKGQLEFKATSYAADPVNYSMGKLALSTTDGKETQLLDGQLRVSAQIDPATQTRTLYFVPQPLPDTAYAGQVARLELYHADDASDDYISIPNSALVKVGINDVVFIQDPTNKNLFVMKKVETLAPRQGMTPVKGLKEGQIIVVKGGYELKYVLPTEGGAAKKAAGHFHADGKFHEGAH
ncbi:MAG: hypothetical protein RR719_08005 [Akkermansia sp.]